MCSCISSHFISGYIPTAIIELNKVVPLSSASACSSGAGSSLTTRPLLNRHLARASIVSDVIGKLSAKGAWAGGTGSLDRLETNSFTTYPEGPKRFDFLRVPECMPSPSTTVGVIPTCPAYRADSPRVFSRIRQHKMLNIVQGAISSRIYPLRSRI